MRTLISDVLDLYRFRVKALPAYYYPLWKIALLLTAIGFVTSSTATDLGSYIPGRIAFCIVYNWLETLLYCGVIGLWLKLSHFKLNRPLLVLVALSSGIQFLAPLVSWLPDDVASIVLLVLLFYSLLVLCYALERVTGMDWRGRLAWQTSRTALLTWWARSDPSPPGDSSWVAFTL